MRRAPARWMAALLALASAVAAAQVSEPATAATAAEPGPSSTQDNPASSPTAGWDGKLPLAPLPPPDYGVVSGGMHIFIDNSLRIGNPYGYGGSGYTQASTGPCGRYNLGGNPRPGAGRTAGYISGGTFGSTVRCDDGYPGLPLRPSPYGTGSGVQGYPYESVPATRY